MYRGRIMGTFGPGADASQIAMLMTGGEQVATGLLRTELIAQLGEFDDEDVIAGARERFQKFLADPKTLPPDLRPAVFGVVGRYIRRGLFRGWCEITPIASNVFWIT